MTKQNAINENVLSSSILIENNQRNTCAGSSALAANPGGATDNVAVGYHSLNSITTGRFNTSVGSSALSSTTTVNGNTAVGYQALQACSSGTFNTAVGNNALSSATSGASNVAVGSGAMSLASGSDCVAIGSSALSSSAADRNIGIGGATLLQNTGGNNVGVGYSVLNAASSATDCTGVGHQALNYNTATGSTAVGSGALAINSSGPRNTAVGYQALNVLTTNNDCCAMGYQALSLNTASNMTAFGSLSLASNTSGGGSSAFGYNALNLSTGSDNTGLGDRAFEALATGGENTGIGKFIGRNYTGAESSNILIGSNVLGTAGESNVLRIGTGTGTALTQQNKAFIAGITGITPVALNGLPVSVSSTGQLATTQSIPAFLVRSSTSQTDVTGDGTVVQVAYDAKIFDYGTNFTTGASAAFTAPVAGIYQFSVQVSFSGFGASVPTSFGINLVTTNRTYTQAYTIAAGAITDPSRWGFSILADMGSGDTAYVQGVASGSTKFINITGSTSLFTIFSGFLVCAI